VLVLVLVLVLVRPGGVWVRGLDGMPVGVDMKFRAGDVLLGPGGEVGVDLFAEIEGGEGVMEGLFLNSQASEGANHHVAADPRKAVEVENPHEEGRGRDQAWT